MIIVTRINFFSKANVKYFAWKMKCKASNSLALLKKIYFCASP